MISSDKIITLGLNTVITGTLYATFGQDLTIRALQWTGGGIALTAVFQACYPSFGGLMKEKCGETFTQGLLWLYPLAIPLAGYLGGLPQRTNLLVSAGFFFYHQLSFQTTCDFALQQRLIDAEPLRIEVQEAMQNGKLETAAKKLEEIDQAVEAGADVGKRSINDAETDKRKKALSSSYLNLSPPNIKEATKWALAIRSDLKKFYAIENILRHLLRTNGDESTILILLDTWGSISEAYAPTVMNVKFDVAVKYKKSELLDEVNQTVSTLNGSAYDVSSLLFLLQKIAWTKKNEMAKPTLSKAKELLGHLEKEQDLYKNCQYPKTGYFHKYFRRETPEREILYLLVAFAMQTHEFSIAEELSNHADLTLDGQIAAHLEIAKGFSNLDKKAKMEEHISKVKDLIASDQAPKETAFRQKWSYAIFKIYLESNPKQAFETIKELPQHHEQTYLEFALRIKEQDAELASKALAELTPIFSSLIPIEQQAYAQLQAELNPEVLFETCGEVDQLSKVIIDPTTCANALLVLAEARLKRREYVQADAIFKIVDQDVPGVKQKVKDLQSWPRVPVKQFWFF